MARSRHPYLCRFDGDKMPCDVPCITLRLREGDIYLKTSAWIDSGAEISLFDAEIADTLDIELEGLRTMKVVGVGDGHSDAYCTKVVVEIEGHEPFECEVGFVRGLPVPALLGARDFFDRFVITFDKKGGAVILED